MLSLFMHFFLLNNFKIFTATNINSWVASHGIELIAALNRKLLRFFPVSYTSWLFRKASSGSIYLVCADTITIPSPDVICFHAIFSFQTISKSLLLRT